MKVQRSETVEQVPVDAPGASGCGVRWLVGQKDGAPNFAMRQFEVAPGGHTPKHSHPHEHEVYVLDGSGVVVEGEAPRPITAGDVVFVAPNDVHQFQNTGQEPLRFLCMVPNSATAQQQDNPVPECGTE